MLALFSRLIIVVLLSFSLSAMAQAPQPATAPSQPLLRPAELDQLLAPIALYSDPLLSQVLIASTYPLEVVQADRWAKSNTNLKGDALTTALGKQSWDDSVKSLVQVPTVLAMMGDQLDWTQKLGDAMLAQQPDVMDSIQRLRGRAQANGKLKSTKEQTVTVKTEDQKQYVVIEPTSPTEIYVPYYDPAVVYGAWPYPDYAPYYFPPPRLPSRRRARNGHRIRSRRRCSPCFLGQLRLGSAQHQCGGQSARQHQQHQSRRREFFEVGAQRGPPSRREIQQ